MFNVNDERYNGFRVNEISAKFGELGTNLYSAMPRALSALQTS